MANLDKTIRDFAKTMQNNGKPKTTPYDTPAEVVRTEGDIVWVHIPGGVDETPVKKTIDAKKGDTVQVRVSGGTAYLIGNASAPPTDDTTANEAKNTAVNADIKAIVAKKNAEEALNMAENIEQHFWTDEDGAHVTQVTQEEYLDDPSNSGCNTLINSNSMQFRDGVVDCASFGIGRSFIGSDDGAQLVLEQNKIQGIDSDKNTYFEISDDGGLLYRTFSDFREFGEDVESINLSSLYGDEWDSIQTGDDFYINALYWLRAPGSKPHVISDLVYYTLSDEYGEDVQVGTGVDDYTEKLVVFKKGTPNDSIPYIEYDGDETISLIQHPEVPSRCSFLKTSFEFITINISATPFYKFGLGSDSENRGAFGFETGVNTKAIGDYSQAHGLGTITESKGGLSIGKYNEPFPGYLFTIGNGTINNPKNAFVVDNVGNVFADGFIAAGNAQIGSFARAVGADSATTTLSTSYKYISMASAVTKGNAFQYDSTNKGIKCLVDGIVLVCGKIRFGSNFTAQDIINAQLYNVTQETSLNTTRFRVPPNMTSPNQTHPFATVPVVVHAGDVIKLRAINSTGSRGTVNNDASYIYVTYIAPILD